MGRSNNLGSAITAIAKAGKRGERLSDREGARTETSEQKRRREEEERRREEERKKRER